MGVVPLNFDTGGGQVLGLEHDTMVALVASGGLEPSLTLKLICWPWVGVVPPAGEILAPSVPATNDGGDTFSTWRGRPASSVHCAVAGHDGVPGVGCTR